MNSKNSQIAIDKKEAKSKLVPCGHCAMMVPYQVMQRHHKNNHKNCYETRNEKAYQVYLRETADPVHPFAKNWKRYNAGLDTVKEEPNNFIDDCGNRRAANNSVHKKKMEKAYKSKVENEQDDGKYLNKSINDSSKE